MKIEEIINNLHEHVSDWDEHPFVKLNDLYKFYKRIDDQNMKIEICKELLEQIDDIILEFNTNQKIKNIIYQMKDDMVNYLTQNTN